MVENPFYKSWHGFQPGSTAVCLETTKLGHPDSKQWTPDGVEEKRIVHKLVVPEGGKVPLGAGMVVILEKGEAAPADIAAFVAANSDAAPQKPAPAASLLPRDPEHMRRLADPHDLSASLNDRARSYLQANCAQCHVEAGGGNSLIDLEFTTPREKMRIFDVRPQHHTFDIADARLIAPGHPERSVLLRRIANRDAGHMPPLATSIVDQEAVNLLTEWIAAMK